MSDVNSALKKELARLRSKVRILEASLELDCRVWTDVDIERHPYPQQGFPMAFSYRAIGGGDRFIVLGSERDAIEKMAQIYAKERYGEKAAEPIELDQSRIGFMFEEFDCVWEVVVPDYSQVSDWWMVVSDGGKKTRYLSNAELDSKKEISWLEADLGN